MARFGVPASRRDEQMTINEFLGVDFTNYPTNVDPRRSPNAPNMVRSVPGKVRKSMGYEALEHYDGAINGVHYLRGVDAPLVHAGEKLYHAGQVLYTGVLDRRSRAFEFGGAAGDGGRLYILDGAHYLVFDGLAVRPVAEVARVPVVTIARAPAGGGVQYEDLNLLGSRFCEMFLGDGESVQYQLSFEGLDDAPVEVELLDGEGVWQALQEGTHFTVDRAAGAVTFLEAPAEAGQAGAAPQESPIEGEDNVRITAARTVPGYAGRISGCSLGVCYGVRGASDRLFVSGNPGFPNYDWFSGQNDPAYFGDLSYSVLGGAGSAIVGYSILGGLLAAYKDERERERNVVVREGTLVDNKPAFPVVNNCQGPGAVAPHSFAYLCGEPLFLTRLGVYALTPADLTGERYSQNRSFFLNGRLLDEPGLEDAVACMYGDYYILCLNGVAYVLDGLQPVAPARGMPYSTRQYASFYRTNLPARVMWERDGRLWFGTADGGIYRFFEDVDDPRSYSDAGEPIVARWETPELGGARFFYNKTFRRVTVRLASAVATGLRIHGFAGGFWRKLGEEQAKTRYFAFGRIVFSKLTFSGDYTPKIIFSRVRVRRTDKARYAFENDALNEPFGLFDIAIEYREGGKMR